VSSRYVAYAYALYDEQQAYLKSGSLTRTLIDHSVTPVPPMRKLVDGKMLAVPFVLYLAGLVVGWIVRGFIVKSAE
jgi:hypothetical protein